MQAVAARHLARLGASFHREVTKLPHNQPSFSLTLEKRREAQEVLRRPEDGSKSPPLSNEWLEQARGHAGARVQSLAYLFSAVGVFAGSGLLVTGGGAVIQAGRGTPATPAAHVSLLPVLYLQWPEGVDPAAVLTRLREHADLWEALSQLAPPVPGLSKEEALSAALSQGLMLEGITGEVGAVTTEIIRPVNQVDSLIESKGRERVLRILNEITLEGKPWRDQYKVALSCLCEVAEEALNQVTAQIEGGGPHRGTRTSPRQRLHVLDQKQQILKEVLSVWSHVAREPEAILGLTNTPAKQLVVGSPSHALHVLGKRSRTTRRVKRLNLGDGEDMELKRSCLGGASSMPGPLRSGGSEDSPPPVEAQDQTPMPGPDR